MNGWNFLLFLILIAGHTQLWVAAVNRTHALPLPCIVLKYLRRLHDLAVPVFPIVLFAWVGFSGPRLLLGGSWSSLHPIWAAYLLVCAGGFLGLVFSAVRWQFRGNPTLQLENHSRCVDIAEEFDQRPVGNGWYRFMVRVPGNELFDVEFSEKTFSLPRLPVSCDGLSVLHLSDWHFTGTPSLPFYERVAELVDPWRCDVAVFTGDLLDRPEHTTWLASTFGRISAPMGRFYILGNHDWFLNPDEIRSELDALGWRDVAGNVQAIEYQGQEFAIGGSERPWMGEHPDFSRVSSDAFRILLSHTPDYIGWAQSNGIDLMLSGHNHGGQVVLPIVGPVYAPSRYGVKYAGGTFYEPPTLLHVSRGLAGLYPLRWNCRPEVSRLILKSG